MAAPTFVAASTGGFDISGAWTATCHAPGAADRIIIFLWYVDGATGVDATISSTTNIKNLAGTAGAWTTLANASVGSPANTGNLHTVIGRSTGTSAPVITGANVSGDDVFYRFYEFQNCSTGTTLATVIENGTAGSTTTTIGTSASAADASVITLDVDRLAINAVAADANVTIATFSGQTGGTWTQPVTAFSSGSGTAGSIAVQTAAMATAGTIDGGTSTLGASAGWGVIGFALIGTTVSTPSGDAWINDRRTPRRRSMQRW